MSDGPIPEADAAEAKRRAEWLHKHKAHKDWIILSVSEVAVIRDELLILERERDEAREEANKLSGAYEDATNYYARIIELKDELDKLNTQLKQNTK